MKRLSGWDAVLLYSETPNVHMHTLKVAVIDVSEISDRFDVKVFRRTLRRRLHKLEPFRYQLVEIPGKFHHPMFREHVDVDLDYHVRPWKLPAPGGRRELDEAIGEIASTPLDRSKPLWEMYLIEGLADGKIAVVGKVHHALADGVASGNLMARGMDIDTGLQDERDIYVTDPVPRSTQLVNEAFRDHMRGIGRLPGLFKYTYDGVRRVRQSGRKMGLELSRPVEPPPTFMNHMLRPERTFATATLPLADVKQTSKHLGVTINDLVLSISAGALRQLLLRYDGVADDPLVASVPVAFDTSDRISGNKFTGMLVALPTHLTDPLERVRYAHDAATAAKESNYLLGPELVSRWTNYLPPSAAEAMFGWLATRDGQNKLQNLTISNVPGPRSYGKVGGALVTELYSVGPLTAAAGLNITVWSYVDQLSISVLSEPATLEDPHELTEAMIAEFVELRRAAGLSTELTPLDVQPQVSVSA
ncbi:wax ester/triacylglycerol synthase family O-acyltransferase [Mycobacterium sp. MYCO198283]|uniref:WS/DGAT/MGAT family O-acyltransferase n=1 Tax=Mycobacterium sp. MYCO198283 TaxID=2883505 RepID=UPI001E5E320F|nr:wax ester/triacylglycerol synthase family O-acyltransferase [Mycobacterium sp. MYCO198283]MCG5431937.1 wax ester/triacylglycerol synthase family O-acyltransferase [Mycobacterium sp. MYCO198283]